MKLKYIALSVLSLAVMAGCEKDHRNDNLYDSAVYFVNNAENGVSETDVMYDVMESLEYPVYVYCSGYYGGSTDVGMTVDDSVLAAYNEENGTALKALPADCYELVKTSATIENRKATMTVKFKVPQLLALSGQADYSDLDDYVLPLALNSRGDIPVSDREQFLGYNLVHPVVSPASIAFSSTALTGNQFTLTVALPFENQWDAEFDLDFNTLTMDEPSTALGNTLPAKYVLSALPAGTAIENEDVMTMEPGVSSVSYTITLPEQTAAGVETFACTLKSAKLNGQEIPISTAATVYVRRTNDITYKPAVSQTSDSGDAAYFGKGLADYAAWGGMTLVDRTGFSYDAQSANNPVSYALDGNTSTHWDNNWGGGYGTRDLPFVAVLDMGAKTSVDAVELWRRSGTYVTDTRSFEIYATPACDHSQGAVTYGELTYMGTADYGDGNSKERLMFQLTDHVETQYLIFNFTASNRGGNCISMCEYNVWHR